MASKNAQYLELTDVAGRIRRKELSPVELTQAMLKRIAKLDPKLHSYATVTADLALAQAKKAETEVRAGRIRGPLHGVPIAVKDLCYTKGIATAAGMPIHRGFKPKFDATVVRRLREAGAILLGKLELTEGAFADHHPDVTPPVNPWNADHWSGASSSGSGVATAAGLCFGSLGSDTGGSIRFPSAANGVTGLKPTWGRVSRHGVFELAATLDHIGPMARSAADAGAILGVIAGADPEDPTASQEPVPNYLAGLSRGVKGLRLGVDAAFNREGVDKVMADATAEAVAVLGGLGAEILPVEFPPVEELVGEWAPLCAIETALAHARTYPAKKAAYGPGLAGLIELGRSLSAMDYQRMLLRRLDFRGRLAALFERIDLLAIPAQFMASPTVKKMATLGEDPAALQALLRFTAPFDLAGNPTITLPAGFTQAGTPVAFQLVARPFAEDLLVRAGHGYQTVTDWHRKHPDL